MKRATSPSKTKSVLLKSFSPSNIGEHEIIFTKSYFSKETCNVIKHEIFALSKFSQKIHPCSVIDPYLLKKSIKYDEGHFVYSNTKAYNIDLGSSYYVEEIHFQLTHLFLGYICILLILIYKTKSIFV